ncbi:MAG: hypothetical protein J7L93_02820 [Thermoplasmata archaeon]|nr:hypothetical protein [Thermoplasmata archaeon]
MIGVLTSDFSFYHDIVHALEARGLHFASLTFDSPIPPDVDVVITSPGEGRRVNFDVVICPEQGQDMDELIDRALFVARKGNLAGNIVIGIDPGSTPGIAIFADGMLFRRFTSRSPQDAVDFISSFIRNCGGADVTVRIGHGARLVRNRIINGIMNVTSRIEMVDETSTTPASTRDDMLAASSIALTPGRVISSKLSVEPKDGEIKDTQRKSRIMSGDVTISKELAKKVLKGEMGMKKAIDRQRGN